MKGDIMKQHNTVISIWNGARRRAHAIAYNDYSKAIRIYENSVAYARLGVASEELYPGNIFYLLHNGKIERKEVI